MIALIWYLWLLKWWFISYFIVLGGTATILLLLFKLYECIKQRLKADPSE